MVLHSALRQAVRMGTIGRNPASFVQTPQQPVKEMSTLDESQVSRFLVSTKSHRWEAVFSSSSSHWRQTNGTAWPEVDDPDWVRQTLKIERQLNRPDGEGMNFSAPKTRFGRRTIALGKKTIEILHKHYERQQAERQTAGNAWQENGLIFTTGKGTPIHHCNLVRDFKKLLKDAGLPDIRFHDLRHTNASLQLNQGIPVITVSRRLGHAKASITLDIYGHLIASLQEDVADMIDDLVTLFLCLRVW